MNLIRGQYLDDFLNSKDYDIRKTNNARWIDQKCTPDVVTIIADCILEYTSDDKNKDIFSSMDIWHNNYTVVNVEDIFKSQVQIKAAKNEYDKFSTTYGNALICWYTDKNKKVTETFNSR